MIQSDSVLVSGGTFVQVNHQQGTLPSNAQDGDSVYMSGNAFKKLGELAILSATHDSGEAFDRPGCHENTRVAVLRRLWSWTDGRRGQKELPASVAGDLTKPVMWVYGDAGAGKSALAQSHAVRSARERRLLGSFFFSRNDTERSTHVHLVATIAYQVATSVPSLKDLILTAIEEDPNIFKKTLETQFTTLIINPINTLSGNHPQPIPHLIIIDGLDECCQDNRQEQGYILKAISQVIQNCIIDLKVLVASRAESEIRTAFDSKPLHDLAARLALDASFYPDDDIRLFLNDTFRKIKKTHTLREHIPSKWPGKHIVEELVQKSSGQFIYASTAAKYISSPRHKPADRLGIILGLRERASDKDIPFATLDALYFQIFSAIPEENIETVRNIFGLLIFDTGDIDFNKLNILQPFLSLAPGDVDFYLMDVISIIEQISGVIRITHASLSDFLLDQRRSSHYHLDCGTFFTSMVKICLNHFRRSTTNEAMGVSVKIFIDFCRQAGETLDLQDTLLALPLDAIFNYCRTNITVEDAEIYKMDLTPRFLDFVTELFKLLETLTDNRVLLDYHLNEFDQCMMKLIPAAICDIDNLVLLTTISGLPRPEKPYWSRRDSLAPVLSNEPSKISFSRARPFLNKEPPKNTAFAMFYEICTQCSLHVFDFFDNPCRSKQYSITDVRYGDAALSCLVYLCQNPYGLQIVRKLTIPRKSQLHLFLPAYYALTYLPQLLSRSAASPELIAFIRSGEFERVWDETRILVLPKNRLNMTDIEHLVRHVLQGCEDYIRRTDAPTSKLAYLKSIFRSPRNPK